MVTARVARLRGQCSWCELVIHVRKDGTLRYHSPVVDGKVLHSGECTGSRQAPRPGSTFEVLVDPNIQQRGICSVCGRVVLVRKSGVVGVHGEFVRAVRVGDCTGAGRPPARLVMS